MAQKGLAPIFIVILIAVLAGGYLIYSKSQSKLATQFTPQPSSSPATSPAPTDSGETANWKTYDGGDYKISYPDTWIYDPSRKGLNSVTDKEGFIILSPDYNHNLGGYIDKGASITLFTKKIPWSTDKKVSEQMGPESIRNVTWLGNHATLQVIKYEGNNLILTAKHNGIDYQLDMYAATDALRNSYEPLFLKIANTLTLK